MSTAPPPTPQAAPAGRLTPPDEQFWQRYSPHHEFPLSTVASVALHIVIMTLLFLGGWAMLYLGLLDSAAPVPVDAVVFHEGGGGGNPNGAGGGPGDDGGGPEVPPENVDPSAPPDRSPLPPVPIKDIDPTQVDPTLIPRVTDAEGKRVVNPARDVIKALGNVNQDARKKMFGGLAGQGKGGSGQDGGRDKGRDTGTGRGEGEGGQISKRQKRVLRWVLIFNTQDGSDYVRQLHGLGAMLAFPNPNNATEYLLIRDLGPRPFEAKAEDLSQINRIFWVDDKPQSVASLSRALGVQPPPPHFVAFFPSSLEEKLLRLELNYANKPEDSIDETRFEVRRGVGGGYEPRVIGQKSH